MLMCAIGNCGSSNIYWNLYLRTLLGCQVFSPCLILTKAYTVVYVKCTEPSSLHSCLPFKLNCYCAINVEYLTMMS